MNRRKKQLEEELAAAKREEARLDQVIVEADSRIESKKQVIVEKDKTIEQLKQQLSSISKLTIEESKYAPFLLKEKGEGEATGEDEKLKGTPLGDVLTNETYAKLTYLSVALDGDKIKDEQ